MGGGFSEKKVVNFEERRKYKQFETELVDEKVQELDEIYGKLRNSIIESSKKSLDSKMAERIIELEEENKVMKNKIKKSFPTHIITYLVICSFVIALSITMLLIRIVYKIYIIDPYYLICSLLISLTLFLTACVSIKDWKDFFYG